MTSDHGEAMGALGRYSEHGTADQSVTRIPLVIVWPGAMPGYLDRLEQTGRSAQAQALREKYPQYKEKP